MAKHTQYDGYDVCAPNCGCNDTGNVTSEELQQVCAFLWMVVCRDCEETPVRVTPQRFAQFVAEFVEVDYVLIQKMVDEKFAAVDFSAFVTQTELTNAINNIVIPPAGPTTDDVDTAIATALNSALSNYTTTTEINNQLLNYYTRTETNDLITGLQAQIATLNTSIINLQTQIDACCSTTSLTPPTADWLNALTGDCPASVSAVVANPDDLPITFTVESGGATLSVTANGNPVPLTDATIPDGATVVLSISHPSANVIGGINVTYEDGDGVTQLIDGIQYDIQCATTTPTNTAPSSNGSVGNVTEDEGTAFDVDMSGCFSDLDGDTLTYAVTSPSPLPSGVTFNPTTGVITFADTVAAGVYNFSVVANDGTEDAAPCTTTVTIDEVVVTVPPITLTGNDCPVSFTLAANNATAQTSNVYIPFTGGVAPFTYTATGLPTGASIHPATGSGYIIEVAPNSPPTPITSPASYDVTITDSASSPQSLTCTNNQLELLDAGSGTGGGPAN